MSFTLEEINAAANAAGIDTVEKLTAALATGLTAAQVEFFQTLGEAGINTKEALLAFVKPGAVAAALAAFDGQIAAKRIERETFDSANQAEIEALQTAREAKRAELLS